MFYLTASNDVVKSFDMVHVRYVEPEGFELWLGEAKLYKSGDEAGKAAVKSVRAHIEQGFLNNEKLLLGPQVSKWLPRHREIRDLLSVQTSLDQLFNTAVFPVCIACDSAAALSSTSVSSDYIEQVRTEVEYLAYEVENSGLTQNVNIMLIYVPLVSKDDLAKAFDDRLKAFSL